MANNDSAVILINNPKKLNGWKLPAQRIAPWGVAGDYKPSLVLLPSGELVMVAFNQEFLPEGKLRESTFIWRSKDGGITWSPRKLIPDMIGREQWLTCTKDGTLFASSHLLVQDINNTDGFVYSYLHRSTDGGQRWERTKILIEGEERCGVPAPHTWKTHTHTSRNIIEMADGTLHFGVSICDSDVAYLWTSRDKGKRWEHGERVVIGNYKGAPYNNINGFFCEDFTYLTKSGRLLHWLRCGPPSPMYPINDGRLVPATDDEGNRTLVCESDDSGRTWKNLSDFGDYGMHYIRVLRLKDGRLLLTFTQRAIFYPLGLQALLSYDDGQSWDFGSDRIIIEGKTPWGMASGGGFGNTVEMADRTLISCYSYRGADNQTHLEVVRWSLP